MVSAAAVVVAVRDDARAERRLCVCVQLQVERVGNDLYGPRGMQTMNELIKDKEFQVRRVPLDVGAREVHATRRPGGLTDGRQPQVDPPSTAEVACTATLWEIHDAFVDKDESRKPAYVGVCARARAHVLDAALRGLRAPDSVAPRSVACSPPVR